MKCYVNDVSPDLISNVGENAIVITKEMSHVFRGLNFRSSETLHLVICSPFKNLRAFHQALGRVCRAGDDGTRQKLISVDEYDEDQNDDLIKSINTELTAIADEKAAKKAKAKKDKSKPKEEDPMQQKLNFAPRDSSK